MKPFNKEEALAGKSVVTRDGRKVVLLQEFPVAGLKYPLLGLVVGETNISTWTYDGIFQISNPASGYDLFMASTTRKGYIAIGEHSYKSEVLAFATHVWPTAEVATASIESATRKSPYVVIPVEWEE